MSLLMDPVITKVEEKEYGSESDEELRKSSTKTPESKDGELLVLPLSNPSSSTLVNETEDVDTCTSEPSTEIGTQPNDALVESQLVELDHNRTITDSEVDKATSSQDISTVHSETVHITASTAGHNQVAQAVDLEMDQQPVQEALTTADPVSSSQSTNDSDVEPPVKIFVESTTVVVAPDETPEILLTNATNPSSTTESTSPTLSASATPEPSRNSSDTSFEITKDGNSSTTILPVSVAPAAATPMYSSPGTANHNDSSSTESETRALGSNEPSPNEKTDELGSRTEIPEQGSAAPSTSSEAAIETSSATTKAVQAAELKEVTKETHSSQPQQLDTTPTTELEVAVSVTQSTPSTEVAHTGHHHEDQGRGSDSANGSAQNNNSVASSTSSPSIGANSSSSSSSSSSTPSQTSSKDTHVSSDPKAKTPLVAKVIPVQTASSSPELRKSPHANEDASLKKTSMPTQSGSTSRVMNRQEESDMERLRAERAAHGRRGAFYAPPPPAFRPKLGTNPNDVANDPPQSASGAILPWNAVPGATRNMKDTRLSRRVSIGWAETTGKRPTMEDAWTSFSQGKDSSSLDIFGVFDGHRGDSAARFAAEHLPGAITSVMRVSKNPSDWLRLGFIQTNLAMKQAGIVTGTTAVVGMYWRNVVFLANAGDSRCVHGKVSTTGNVATRMTQDHKPERLDETERIVALGGEVHTSVNKEGKLVGRVNGQLGVSRALGDFDLEPFIIPDPEITQIDLLRIPEPIAEAIDGHESASSSSSSSPTKSASSPKKASSSSSPPSLHMSHQNVGGNSNNSNNHGMVASSSNPTIPSSNNNNSSSSRSGASSNKTSPANQSALNTINNSGQSPSGNVIQQSASSSHSSSANVVSSSPAAIPTPTTSTSTTSTTATSNATTSTSSNSSKTQAPLTSSAPAATLMSSSAPSSSAISCSDGAASSSSNSNANTTTPTNANSGSPATNRPRPYSTNSKRTKDTIELDHVDTSNFDFLVLACDGLWDVMSDEEAINIAAHVLQHGRQPEEAAKRLRNVAFGRGSTDNITVLVVILQPPSSGLKKSSSCNIL